MKCFIYKEAMLLSVVIPVYNEAPCLEANLEAVEAFLRPRFGERHEIVCVDDGSRDGSGKVLAALDGRLPLRVLTHPENRGKGAAVRTGMAAARGETVFFFDADLSTPLVEMERFWELLRGGAHVVIGTRKSAGAKIKRFQPPHRVVMGLGYTYLVNLVMGLRISDYTCGFKAFSRKAVDAIVPRLTVDGWSFDVEILYLARRLGFEVREVPVTWENRPGSKVRLVRDTMRSFRELLQIRRRHRDAGP